MATLEQQLVFIRMAIFQAFSSEEASQTFDPFSTENSNKHYGTIVPLNNNAFEFSRIIKSVRKLGNLRQNWIFFAYTDTDFQAINDKLTEGVWTMIQPVFSDFDDFRPKRKKQIQLLSYLACYVFRSRVNTIYPGMSITAMCKELGMSRGNFKRDLFEFWAVIIRHLEIMDTDTLMTIHNESFLPRPENPAYFDK